MLKVLIFYSEIGIKGKNKGDFERALKKNIKYAAKFGGVNLNSIKKEGNGFVCEFDEKSKEKVSFVLKSVFGIKFFSFVTEIDKTKRSILKEAEKFILKLKEKKVDKLNIITKRADKSFELTSPELNSLIGDIAKKNGIKIDYKNKENILFIKINFTKAFIYYDKILAGDGLPVGTSGRVLVLLSGGIDSPVAAYQLMKRGCSCDFLHLHNLKSEKEFEKSKIIETVRKLNRFQFKSKLYSVNYEDFEFEIMGKVFPRYELVIFKHYLLKLAQKIAIENGYHAIANGDSLAQVASQTIENLNVVNLEIDWPIFRPLLTYEKESIIEVAKKIGTFEISCENYKDCCSLVALNPLTKAKREKMQRSLEKIDLDKLIEKNISKMKIYSI